MYAASLTRFLSAAAVLAVADRAVVFADTASTPSAAPSRPAISSIDFERHLMGLFGRMGCNSGSCHGSFQGKGGFRLSLFGYDPEKDYFAVTRDVLSRRINAVDPDRSLLLLKATGQVEHGGGKRFATDSWQYQVLREWVAGGARWQKASGEVASIAVLPSECAFPKPGVSGQLRVQAQFTDGSVEDITAFCDFRSNDEAVAEVSSSGKVKGMRPGDTALVVSYRGNVLAVRVLVPLAAPPDYRYPSVPEVNYVDQAVFAKLRRLNMVPSDLSSDAEFLRRVTIDTVGTLPSPEEVRAFLADRDPEKRVKKVDELLAHPMHAALWATKFCDITGNNTDLLEQPNELKAKRSQMWHDWFRKRVAENMPYDEIVRGVLCATSRDGLEPDEWVKQVKTVDEAAAKGFASSYADRPSLDLFWRRQQANVPIEQWGEKTAAAFMGIRLECAQCHKHPFDRWSQTDYRAHANLFGQVVFNDQSPEAKKAITAENQERNKGKMGNRQIALVREVYVANRARSLPHPDTNRPLPAKALGGPEIRIEAGQDARVALFDWLRSPDNPYFARSLVNRVWGHYFGVGIVEPVDNFSIANPPSNDRLLDALAKDFAEHGYDIRHIERTILRSRTYQLSSATNETNRLDRNNYSHSTIRPMLAEVVVDVVSAALDVSENFGADAPSGARAIEIGASRLQNGSLNYAFRIFGRPPRTAACDCERAMEPALPQKLFMMTDPSVLAKLQAAVRNNGRLQTLLRSEKTDDEVLDELFLATLTRYPAKEEKQSFAAHRASAKDRAAAFVDALWALVNTREFILNH